MQSSSAIKCQKGGLLIESLLGILLLGLYFFFYDQLVLQTKIRAVQNKEARYIDQIKSIYFLPEAVVINSNLDSREFIAEAECSQLTNSDLELNLTTCNFTTITPRERKHNWVISRIETQP
ncbi:MAG: hypothetical protein KBC84_02350 [Proteobacteria bacterium]|nr:hypothetical protein [Pseudomonadota bacterium]